MTCGDVEYTMGKERFSQFLQYAVPFSATLALSMFAFSREQKDRAMQEHDFRCQKCRRRFPANGLYAHHRLPEQFGGATNDANLYLVCAGCHKEVDKQAVMHGRIVGGMSISEVASDEPELIENKQKYQKAANRFARKK